MVTRAIAAFSSALLVASASGQCSTSADMGRGHEASTVTISLVSHAEAPRDLVATASRAGAFNTLLAAAKAAGLVEALQAEGPLTVFAPTDEAFAQLPAGTVESLLKPQNRDLLRSILLYHVVPGRVEAEQVVGLTRADALNGQRLSIKVDDQGVRVAGANVVQTDVQASNGVIHVIDRVMMPATDDLIETATSAGTFETLAAALDAAQLVHALQGDGPFTVFAPTDEAFANLPAGTVESLLKPKNRHDLQAVLKHHVVSGRVYASDAVAAQSAQTLEGTTLRVGIQDGRLSVNGAHIIKTDIDTTNGVIHVIDRVLLP